MKFNIKKLTLAALAGFSAIQANDVRIEDFASKENVINLEKAKELLENKNLSSENKTELINSLDGLEKELYKRTYSDLGAGVTATAAIIWSLYKLDQIHFGIERYARKNGFTLLEKDKGQYLSKKYLGAAIIGVPLTSNIDDSPERPKADAFDAYVSKFARTSGVYIKNLGMNGRNIKFGYNNNPFSFQGLSALIIPTGLAGLGIAFKDKVVTEAKFLLNVKSNLNKIKQIRELINSTKTA